MIAGSPQTPAKQCRLSKEILWNGDTISNVQNLSFDKISAIKQSSVAVFSIPEP